MVNKFNYGTVSLADLHQRIIRIYDHLYANAPVRTPQGIADEVGKILHVGIYIESKNTGLFIEDTLRQPAFNYSFSQIKKLTQGDESLCHEIAQHLRQKFTMMNQEWELYPATSNLLIRDADIGYVCALLNQILISDSNRDVFGDALEIFRGQWAKRTGGQFFTDQQVTTLAMILLDFDPRRGDDLIDICAGTGGFLLAGLNRIKTLLAQDNMLTEATLIDLALNSIKGYEIDTKVGEIANATLRARLSKTQHPFVLIADSLQSAIFLQGKHIRTNAHMCAATNPPFGTKTTIKSHEILRNFDLARTGNSLAMRSPDILFIEQNLQLLKPGLGRLAIVVPYQILSGPQTRFVREWILRHAQIQAVIDLPADTFQPHTGTKACLLIIKRRETPLQKIEDIDDTLIFMSAPRWIGHDRRGNPVYKRLPDGKLTDEILTDFPQVAVAYTNFLNGQEPQAAHDLSFYINARKLLRDNEIRLNALYHKPLNNLSSKTHQRSADWHCVKLSSVISKIFFPTRFKRNYVEYYPGAVPFLGGANISQLIVSTDKWLRHDDPKLIELRVYPGWLLVTRSGTTGIVSSVPAAWDGFAISEHVIRIIPDPKKLDAAYLHTFLRTQFAQETLSRGVFGSVIDEITPEFVGDLDIWIPNSDSVLQEITAKAHEAQTAREKAIDALTDAVQIINTLL
jgi:type I restriction-modification system DNA methylase subunit